MRGEEANPIPEYLVNTHGAQEPQSLHSTPEKVSANLVAKLNTGDENCESLTLQALHSQRKGPPKTREWLNDKLSWK